MTGTATLSDNFFGHGFVIYPFFVQTYHASTRQQLNVKILNMHPIKTVRILPALKNISRLKDALLFLASILKILSDKGFKKGCI